MMRKYLFLLSTALTFSLAALWGHSLAAQTSPAAGSVPENRPAKISSEASQQNLLVIQLDQVDAPQPALQSVWLAAYFKSEHQTVLTLTQLFPSQQNKRFASLDKAFSIDQNGKPSRQFFRSISGGNIQWNGYLITDFVGAQQIDQWLADQGVPIFAQHTLKPKETLETACDYFRNGSVDSDLKDSIYDWSTFSPHFQTDMDRDTLLGMWNGLLDATRPTRCEVISE
jgi:hypothetical protein